ncbi:hypothetical protein [Streptomyces sp. NPDC058330]|uniref:hypothetical protein n=1 Tax=Streptomyces sp. NPDC058330 TaxID=3346449 RepID=UPI0036E8B903
MVASAPAKRARVVAGKAAAATHPSGKAPDRRRHSVERRSWPLDDFLAERAVGCVTRTGRYRPYAHEQVLGTGQGRERTNAAECDAMPNASEA